MNKDSLYALIIAGIFLSVVIRGWFCYRVLEGLLSLSKPGATIVLLSGLLYLYVNGLKYTSLMYGLLVVYLLADIWHYWPMSHTRAVMLDKSKDDARFTDSQSIDLAFARHTAVHDSPNMLRKDVDATPLLLYPPSDATLQSMSG